MTEAAPKRGRNAALFIKHLDLDDLRRRLRRYRKARVDYNAQFHTSQSVIEYLRRHEGRIEVHLLPNCSPDLNLIERVRGVLHEHVTRNHRCKSPEELLGTMFARIPSTRWRRLLELLSLFVSSYLGADGFGNY